MDFRFAVAFFVVTPLLLLAGSIFERYQVHKKKMKE